MKPMLLGFNFSEVSSASRMLGGFESLETLNLDIMVYE